MYQQWVKVDQRVLNSDLAIIRKLGLGSTENKSNLLKLSSRDSRHTCSSTDGGGGSEKRFHVRGYEDCNRYPQILGPG
jgi:hypothetical protein